MNNPEIWTEIHRLAEELYMLQPWEYMEETDIFGVRANLSGKTYFISVMGSGDQIRALSAYEGAPGLYGFWELEDNPSIRPESVLLIPHIMLSFVSKAILDKTQKEILKITGFDKRKLREWPEVQRIIPGLVPAIPEESYLGDFAEILIQVLNICSRAKHDLNFLFPEKSDEDTYLVRESVLRGKKTVWTDKYRRVVPEPESFDTGIKNEDIEEMKLKRLVRNVIQADCRLIPAPIREKGKPDCFPFILMIADKKTGIIEGLETLTPLPDYHSMVERLPLGMVRLINKLKFKPGTIEVTDEALYELLYREFSMAGIRVILVKSMKSIEEAFESLIADLAGKG